MLANLSTELRVCWRRRANEPALDTMEDGIEMWPKFIVCGAKTRRVTLSKWLPAFILGPILPACYCVAVITLGQITFSANGFRTNTLEVICPKSSRCQDGCRPLAEALYRMIQGAYSFLFVFSWVFFGFSASFTLENKKSGKKRVFSTLTPFTSLRTLFLFYIPIFLFNLFCAIMLTIQAAISSSCTQTSLVSVSMMFGVFFLIGAIIMLIYLLGIFCSKNAALLAAQGMQKLREGTSKSDVEIAEQKFDKYDLDKSGTMDAKDLSLLMEDLKLRLKAPEIAQLEKEIAGDDGVITKDAFIDWYVKDKDERDQLGDDDDEGGDGGDEDDEKADE